MMNALAQTKKIIQAAIDYTESHLGNIEEIIISTPTPMQGLLDGLLALPIVAKRHQNIVVHNSGDSYIKAVKLFQEQDVRTYIQKRIGTYTVGEDQ
jgi:hypothetical protein